MCTVVFGWQLFPGTPIVVAANRDERVDRRARPPETRGERPAVLAPRDEKAGGTWMGVNEHNVFAGLTNRWLETESTGARSRGLLVDDVLRAPTAERGVETVGSAVEAAEYDGFNLVVADRTAAFLLEYDGTLACREFESGVHVLVNTGADGEYAIPADREAVASRQAANADALKSALRPAETETPEEWLDRAETLLGDHEVGVCIHGDGYGTVSASLIAIQAEGGVEYRYADGPPCRTDARPVDNQL